MGDVVLYIIRHAGVDEASISEHLAATQTQNPLKSSIRLFDDSDYSLPQHLQRYAVVTDFAKVCYEVWCQKKKIQQSELGYSISSKSEDLLTRRMFEARKFRAIAVYKMKL